jgi:hypothetical protein
VAQEGKPRAMTGHSTQKTALETTELENPIKLLNVSDLGIHQTRPNGMCFKPNNGS